MDHNLFKFTIRCKIDESKPVKSATLNYLWSITDNLGSNLASLDDVYALPYGRKSLSYVKLYAHDYGVIQVGISIINYWIVKLFTGSTDSGVLVEAVVAHPMNELVSGALIQWDRENDSPIIHELEL